MARVSTVVVPKPEFDALDAEVERLRKALDNDAQSPAFEAMEAEVERLRKIEEAARVFAAQPGVRLSPPFETAWLDLRAALEEEA